MTCEILKLSNQPSKAFTLVTWEHGVNFPGKVIIDERRNNTKS